MEEKYKNMINLGQFISESCGLIRESVRNRDIEKAQDLMRNYLRKRKIYTMPGICSVRVEGQYGFEVTVFNEKNEAASIFWSREDSSTIFAVGFIKDFNNWCVSKMNPGSKSNWDVYVEAKGANIVQMMKLIESVLTGKVRMEVTDIRTEIADAQLFENEEADDEILTEASKDPHVAELERQRFNIRQKIKYWEKKGKDSTELQKELQQTIKALNDARTSIRPNVSVETIADNDVESANDNFFEELRATPEERFDDMKQYIYQIVLGRSNLALICGAPGVGKTYRVMQIVKGTGKQAEIDYSLLKGKSTATALFKELHDFKEKGQIMIMDDCDSVFKDPDAINLLKAAYDSSEDRWVTWNTANLIPMSPEKAEMCDDAVWDSTKSRWYYPAKFIYEGSGIIITNYSAGQIDTAIRNRALMCDLNFTTEEILGLIRDIASKITGGGISEDAKTKTYEYLLSLAKKDAPVELSIRSFIGCAKLYATDAPDRQKQRMVNEQMRLQFMKVGKHY